MINKKTVVLIAVAILFKSALFLFSATKVPQLKIRNDTHWYLGSGLTLVSEGVFGAKNKDGSFSHQYYRTPGYPLFLGIFHGILKIPLNGIILLQILLTIFSSVIIFKTANIIDPKLAPLSLFIILFDPAITVYSLMLLTESLFLFLISYFLYTMVKYLQKQKIKYLLLSALILAAATYVRPISFYLGGTLAIFILITTYSKSLKKSIVHACVFVVIVHSLLFLWQWRNYNHFHEFQFSNIENSTVGSQGIYKSYSHNQDPISAGLSPVPYYLNVTSRCLLSLYTRPVSFKYFELKPIKKIGKIFSYLWIAFWLSGFLRGISKMDNNKYFYFLLLVICYFTAATVLGIMWMADGRFRVPMMPYIAILSAYGWGWLCNKKTSN